MALNIDAIQDVGICTRGDFVYFLLQNDESFAVRLSSLEAGVPNPDSMSYLPLLRNKNIDALQAKRDLHTQIAMLYKNRFKRTDGDTFVMVKFNED